MRKLLLFFAVLIFYCGAAFSQDSILPAQAYAFVGKNVVVCGKIYGGRFLDKANRTPTLLNMGAAYPQQPLTIVIWGDTRKLFSFKPEERYLNKELCITGKIDTYKEKPQLVVTAVSQIKEKE